MKLLILFVAATVLCADCLPVDGDRILARDVAVRIPEFAKLAGDEVIGLAPLPTVRRVMSGGELARVGRKFGIEIASPADVCFELPTEVLTSSKVLDHIRAAVAMEGVEIAVIEFSRYPVPLGVLSFPRSGLNVHPLLTDKSVVFWRGKVTYAGTKSFSVWARVRMGIQRERLVASETIRSGAVITERQVRMEQVRLFPFLEQSGVSVGEVVGQVARRTIAAGQPVMTASLGPPTQVTRGTEVSVMVKSAGAQLSLPALAESSGAVGETVSLKNPVNGRTFRGVVEGKNRVLVTAK
jgi:flagella basal body P-ring formation protein FlgA